jgi:hypothetical protein
LHIFTEEEDMTRSRTFSCMLTVLALSTLVSFAPAGWAEDDVQALEKALWKAWAAHDLATFEQRLADDHVHISGSGIIAGKAANLKDMKEHPCEVRSFEVGEIASE